MDYKHSKMLGDDAIRIPFNCDQGFEEHELIFSPKSVYEAERELIKVVCSRGLLTKEEHEKCIATEKDLCWKDGQQP